LFDVSRTVVRQALKELTYEGLITREKGRGTFVAEPKINEGLFQSLTGFYQDMLARGHQPISRVLKQELIPASRPINDYLKLAPGDQVIEIQRLRFVQDEPIVLVTTYLPYSACPSLLQVDLTHRSLYEYIEEECGLRIARGRRTIEAVAAGEEEAHLLQVEEGAPLILLNSISYLEDGTPIEYYRALHRGDRARFEVALVRYRSLGRASEPLNPDKAPLPSGGSGAVDLVRL
jgi:GntR family transcriptional regulator